MAYDLPILTVSRNSILNSTPVGILSHQFYAAYLNSNSLFGWLVADGWCWFVLREEYCWLVAAGCWWLVRSERKVLLAGG
jgi:hypothetical protein